MGRTGFKVFGCIAVGILLLGFTLPVGAAVKVLQYNADGTVKGVTSGEKNKAPQAPGGTASSNRKDSPDGRYIEGELIVTNPPRQFESVAKSLGFSIVNRTDHASLRLTVIRLRTPSKYTVAEAKALLGKKISRLNVDANHTYNITGTVDVETLEEYPQLAALTVADRACGRGVRIGMIDGGVNLKHPALTNQKIKYKRFNTKVLKPGPAVHGTAIAGMFVGTLPEQGLGGFLPGAEVKAANVQEAGPSGKLVARVSNILDAIDWLISEKVHVINFNIAGADNNALRAAVDRARGKGVIMVAAVGNWGSETEAAFPAAYPDVIGVTGVDNKNKAYRRANEGAYVDFATKAVRVWTAGPDGGGQFMSGTSYSTPMISSLVAMEVARGKKPGTGAIRTYLRQYAVDLGPIGKDKTFGWGLVNAASLCK